MPSLCPVCGRYYCDHTAQERGQTRDEMMRDTTDEEHAFWLKEQSNSDAMIAFAKAHAHDPVPEKK
ncbi:MAG: hypothetical protein WC528_02700 [Patescibacteria group bacterium]